MFSYLAVTFFHQLQIGKFHLVIETIERTFAYHSLNPFLCNGVAALEWLHDCILPVHELLTRINFAIFILHKVRIQLRDSTAVFCRNLNFLVSQRFA